MNSNHHVLSEAGETPAAPNLEYWEGIIAQGLPNREAVALALLEIHSRKLYREGYGSFQAYLRQRWHFSRARGYQLLHFARLKTLSTAVDTPGPENERQARRLDELDYPDVAGIACPKPMMFLCGRRDPLFPTASVEAAFGKLQAIWASQKALDRLVTRFYDAPHEFNAAMQEEAFLWLDRQLVAGQ